MKTELDLRPLAHERQPTPPATRLPRPRQRWLTRYVVPLGILLGFVVLLGVSVGQRLLPVQTVTVVPVIVKRADIQQAGTPLFQSPGWIEPRPTPVSVPALAAGVVEHLLVVEGEHVTRGQPVAHLIDVDAKLAVAQAQAVLAIREGELKGVMAERDAAQSLFENPVHLEAQLAEAESMLAGAKTDLGNLPGQIEKATAELAYAEASLEGKRNSGGAVAGIALKRAEADCAAAQATLKELRGRGPNLTSKVAALERKSQALRQQLQLLIEEKRQLEAAKAKVETANAKRDEAVLALQQLELNLSRMVVTAPSDGRVLRLVASPGDRVMGMDQGAEHRSSTVVQIYDPQKLQVRADVRLEDVPLVSRGQPVTIQTASSDDAIQGRVLQTTSSANIQKNTLEVKIELIDPPPAVTPEMLVTATFMAPQAVNAMTASQENERLFVPSLLVQAAQTGQVVWLVGAGGIAEERSVEIGAELENGLVEVKKGLDRTDKLIASGLENLSTGTRVKVIGDDQRLGIAK